MAFSFKRRNNQGFLQIKGNNILFMVKRVKSSSVEYKERIDLPDNTIRGGHVVNGVNFVKVLSRIHQKLASWGASNRITFIVPHELIKISQIHDDVKKSMSERQINTIIEDSLGVTDQSHFFKTTYLSHEKMILVYYAEFSALREYELLMNKSGFQIKDYVMPLFSMIQIVPDSLKVFEDFILVNQTDIFVEVYGFIGQNLLLFKNTSNEKLVTDLDIIYHFYKRNKATLKDKLPVLCLFKQSLKDDQKINKTHFELIPSISKFNLPLESSTDRSFLSLYAGAEAKNHLKYDRLIHEKKSYQKEKKAEIEEFPVDLKLAQEREEQEEPAQVTKTKPVVEFAIQKLDENGEVVKEKTITKSDLLMSLKKSIKKNLDTLFDENSLVKSKRFENLKTRIRESLDNLPISRMSKTDQQENTEIISVEKRTLPRKPLRPEEKRPVSTLTKTEKSKFSFILKPLRILFYTAVILVILFFLSTIVLSFDQIVPTITSLITRQSIVKRNDLDFRFVMSYNKDNLSEYSISTEVEDLTFTQTIDVSDKTAKDLREEIRKGLETQLIQKFGFQKTNDLYRIPIYPKVNLNENEITFSNDDGEGENKLTGSLSIKVKYIIIPGGIVDSEIESRLPERLFPSENPKRYKAQVAQIEVLETADVYIFNITAEATYY